MTYLGIDLHTCNMTICAVSSNGKKIGVWNFTNHTDQLDKLIREISGPVKVVIELRSTWYWLADWATNQNVELMLVHAKMFNSLLTITMYLIMKNRSFKLETNPQKTRFRQWTY